MFHSFRRLHFILPFSALLMRAVYQLHATTASSTTPNVLVVARSTFLPQALAGTTGTNVTASFLTTASLNTTSVDSTDGNGIVEMSHIVTAQAMPEPWKPEFGHTHMWDELCDSVELCIERCIRREPCASYKYNTNTECHLYRELNHTYPKVHEEHAETPSQGLPPDCSINSPCSCPAATRVRDPVTREKACEVLDGKKLHFTGDSLIRDTWTALGVWLAAIDVDIFDGQIVENHAACMINAWKFLDYVGGTEQMKSRGVFSDSRFTVCSGRTNLTFMPGNKFVEIKQKYGAHVTRNDILSPSDYWIVGSGVHQMVEFRDREEPVHDFIKWLDQRAVALASNTNNSSGTHVVYLGTHHRIIELAPKPYRGYARGPQGNNKIVRWNHLFCDGLKRSSCIDPYWITSSLNASYPDTEDGMHMGFWINLQKVQLLLKEILRMHTL